MTGGHATWEALAGAVLLREASAEEREAYARHAATCPHCDEGIDATATLVLSAVTTSQHGETWRPNVRDGVIARIERRVASWDNWVRSALTIAVAGTLALNLALLLGSVRIWPITFGGSAATVAARRAHATTGVVAAAQPVAPAASVAAESARPERMRTGPPECLEVVCIDGAHRARALHRTSLGLFAAEPMRLR